MKIKNFVKKVMASVSAVAMMVGMIGAIPTEAAGVSFRSDSRFRYNLTASIVSDTKIEVKVNVTNNPGFSSIAFAIFGDEDCNLTYATHTLTGEYAKYTPAMNNTCCQYIFAAMQSTLEGDLIENTSKFSFVAYFETPNATSAMHEFSSTVYCYKSKAENIHFDNTDTYASEDEDTSINAYPYCLGDLDNNKIVNLDDAYEVNKIIAANGKSSIRVSVLNNYLKNGTITTLNGALIDWRNRFPNLTRAEAADVDFTGSIDHYDSEKIMQYYSDKAAGLPVSTLIGSNRLAVVTV